MKIFLFFLLLSLTQPVCGEEAPTPEQMAAKHREESSKVADAQDELAADVQQLVIEQTVPEVIKLLDEVQDLMDEVTDSLAKENTGGETMAAQTVIIEKINQAAQKRQESQGGGEAGGAMLEMMQRMMGKEPQDTPNPDAKQPGKGQTGESDRANAAEDASATDEKVEQRRVPKAAGTAGSPLPPEFQKAMDAYNRGTGQK